MVNEKNTCMVMTEFLAVRCIQRNDPGCIKQTEGNENARVGQRDEFPIPVVTSLK